MIFQLIIVNYIFTSRAHKSNDFTSWSATPSVAFLDTNFLVVYRHNVYLGA